MNLFLRMIGKVFGVLIVCDLLIELRLRMLVAWIEEWFDLSQKRIEQALIVIYLICGNLPLSKFALATLASSLLIAWLMYRWHRRPAAMRGYPSLYGHLMRILVVIPIIMLTGLHFLLTHEVFFALSQIAYMLIFYLTDFDSGGIRGRRRKLALAELKKLFGDITWLPKPAEVGV